MKPDACLRANGLPSPEIAHLVHQNEELQHLSEQLYALNQTKNRCIGVVAHDLQNPLTNLRLLAAKLRKAAEGLTPAQQQWVDEIDETARRMGDLIRHTLDLNRIERGATAPAFAPTDLLPLLATVLNRFAHLAERKGIGLRLESNVPQAWAATDPEYVAEIVENLLSNALKYSPPGKSVWVSVCADADALRVVVRDEGPGIPADERPRLFGSFVTLSPRPTAGEPSTGLGLSIAKAYADQLGATLGYEERPGAGATFVLALPVSPGA